MELLISMKAETLNKGIYFEKSTIMQMPTAQSDGYFIAEIREADDNKRELLRRYVDILREKLSSEEDYGLEITSLGFKLLKRVDEDIEYMDAWERWVRFTRTLYRELNDFVEE